MTNILLLLSFLCCCLSAPKHFLVQTGLKHFLVKTGGANLEEGNMENRAKKEKLTVCCKGTDDDYDYYEDYTDGKKCADDNGKPRKVGVSKS